MRDQYAGDVSDLLKIAFLRSLAGKDRRLGVAWYYVPLNDGSSDGHHLEWRTDPEWKGLDHRLHEQLSQLSVRSVEALERSPIWPDATSFFRAPVPGMAEREAWFNDQRRALGSCDLLFLDPDNGLGSATKRHATLAEVKALRRAGRALAFITFPGRTAPHSELVRGLHEKLMTEAGATGVFTLRTSVSLKGETGPLPPRLRWFTVIDSDESLRTRARTFSMALAAVPGAKVATLGL